MATKSVTVLGSTASAGTATGTIVLDPVAKSTTIIFTVVNSASTTQGLSQVEYSLDDPSALGAATTTWALLSSATAIASSVVAATPLSWTVLSPIGMVRVNSTQGSTGVAPPSYTLKALQSVTA